MTRADTPFVLLLSFSLVSLSRCFIPDSLYGVASRQSHFHTAITTNALVQVAKDYFNSQLEDSAPRISRDTITGIFLEFFGNRQSGRFFDAVVDQVKKACASVDKDDRTQHDPVWHFDAERIIQGHEKMQEHFLNIITLIIKQEFDAARSLLGRALHPLQDFYSHTNWVEMGKTQPNYNLGVPDRSIGVRIAGERTPTCVDCRKDSSSRIKSLLLKLSLVDFALGLAGGDGDNVYECVNNIKVSHELTSGYYVKQKDENGKRVRKPKGVGKCSHGGIIDGSSDRHALGGINKDSQNNLFSSHDYLHAPAAAFALNASVYWINEIRKGLADDKLFAEFLQLTPGTSLAFVIDVSPAMSAYSRTVDKKVIDIMDRLENGGPTFFKYIMTPYSRDIVGPSIEAKSRDDLLYHRFEGFQNTFEIEIQKGYTSNSRRMYEAIIRAAVKSMMGGHIYVINSGIPTDEHLNQWLSEVLIQKRIKLNIIYTYELEASLGRVYRDGSPFVVREEEVHFAAITGKPIVHSTLENVTAAVDDVTFREDNTDVLLTKTLSGSHKTQVDIDSNVTEFKVTIISEAPVHYSLYEPGPTMRNVLLASANVSQHHFDEFHTIQVKQPKSGKWQVQTIGSGNEKYTVEITAQALMPAVFNLLTVDATSLHPGLQDSTSNRPLARSKIMATVQAPDGVTPLFTEFYCQNGSKFIASDGANRDYGRRNFYYTMLDVPTEPFRVGFYGLDSKQRRIVRIRNGLIVPTTIVITPDRLPQSVIAPLPGKPYGVRFTITNHGDGDTFKLRAWDSEGYLTAYDPQSLTLGRNETGTVDVHLQVASNAEPGLVDEVGLVATSTTRKEVVFGNECRETLIVSASSR